MYSSKLRLTCAGAVLGLLWSCGSPVVADDAKLLLSFEATRQRDYAHDDSGRQLFEREWSHKDSLSRNGDGLGPMFNARSCSECHHQQGSGGGGGNKHNVDLLTLVDFQNAPTGKTRPPTAIRTRAIRPPARDVLEVLHPGFKTANSVTLHAASTLKDNSDYGPYRAALLGDGGLKGHSVPVRRTSDGGRDYIQWGSFRLQLSHRNTPSLFGAGLIDKISDEYFTIAAQEALQEAAEAQNRGEQASVNDVVLARRLTFAARTPARFGWKGQTATLKAFVAGACANELGLQTKGIPQAAVPGRPDYHNEHVDMTAGKLAELVDYVASLPPPKRWNPSSDEEAAGMTRGAVLFGQAKCQSCHVQDVEHVRGLYSDLQLHDMGTSLTDPTGPASTSSPPRGAIPVSFTSESASSFQAKADDADLVIGVASSAGAAPYYGPSVEQLAPMWRTPPLWGVRDSAPYLHDGRAATLDEAIKMHDGEAADSAARYRRMSAEERRDLLAFVYSLGAP